MVAAILAPSSPRVFDTFMRAFLSKAVSFDLVPSRIADESQISLPQVHVLNCLREVFTNSRFRDRTEEWIMSALKTATICLSSNTYVLPICMNVLYDLTLQQMGDTQLWLDAFSCLHSEALSTS